jgi:hypothetical protein
LGDREALNIEELEADKTTTVFITTASEKDPSFSFVFSGFEDFLALEYPGLFNKIL